MIIKGLIDEDFINYKKPAMVIEFPYCTFKCDKECGQLVCQNSPLVNEPNIEISYDDLLTRYINNPITEAIIFQGLEPCDSISDVINLILWLRLKYNCKDDIVIYTGYKEEEIKWLIDILSSNTLINTNIIIKFGRYIPNQEPHFDPILGVNLASDNQYAKKIC
jgi:hypothetical protein